ncbi:MAG TPA: YrdB family protein [Solirubrobacteraceae bacterium]|jgi:hypothetical protein|nr:YrdB family protein [Solirubrobacteraceae bacterium]
MIDHVQSLKAGNLALKFLLELAAFAAFAYWGASAGSGVGAILLAIATPAVAVLVWGRFAAPKATRRLRLGARVPLELGVFGLAVLALLAVGSAVAAILLGALTIVNSVLLTVLDQWSG